MIDENLLEGNKYFKWYWSICNKAKDRVLSPDIYVEKHHIYPKSIYGQNKDLVKLTAKEHYIVHLLLWLGLRTKYGKSDAYTRKMAGAFSMMNSKAPDHKRCYNSNKYSFVREAFIESKNGKKRSDEFRKSISGTNHYAYGTHLSEERKNQLSISGKGINKGVKNGMYGKIPKREHIEKSILKTSKPVYQYNMMCEFISYYKSQSDAGRITGIDTGRISSCCNHKRKSAGNYIWSNHELSELEIKYLVDLNKNKYNHNKNNKNNHKNVEKYDLDGNFIIEYYSIKDASIENNISMNDIINCCKNRIYSISNFIFKYKI